MGLLDRLRKKQPNLQSLTDAKDATDESEVSSKSSASTPAAIASASAVSAMNTQAAEILLKPLVTEKSTMNGTYVFQVSQSANKPEIMKAFQAVYGVRPVHVRILNQMGKQVRFGGRSGKRPDWKKAIVRLAPGETISVYQGT